MDDERRALIAGICESPNDDLPRLVYADWLDERGESVRANLIRGHLNKTIRKMPAELVGNEVSAIAGHHADGVSQSVRGGDCTLGYGENHQFKYHRGMVTEIVLPKAAFLIHARSLFELNPIDRVTLADCDPAPFEYADRMATWGVGGESDPPFEGV